MGFSRINIKLTVVKTKKSGAKDKAWASTFSTSNLNIKIVGEAFEYANWLASQRSRKVCKLCCSNELEGKELGLPLLSSQQAKFNWSTQLIIKFCIPTRCN